MFVVLGKIICVEGMLCGGGGSELGGYFLIFCTFGTVTINAYYAVFSHELGNQRFSRPAVSSRTLCYDRNVL